MDQDKQTLLEAAKEVLSRYGLGGPEVPNILRAAIAREEARPPATTDGERRCWEALVEEWRKGHDEQKARAQQAEASAAWWKAEGERLSAELALAKNQMTLAIERSERLSGQLRGCEYDLGQTGKLRNRAEKAEAELAKEREYKEAFRDDLNSVRAALHAAPNETATDAAKLLRQRAEEADACIAKLQQSHPMDGGEITVMLNRAGVKAWKPVADGAGDLTTPERVKWLIESWESARTQASNLERTRNALLDAIEKRKAESLNALSLLAKAIGGES